MASASPVPRWLWLSWVFLRLPALAIVLFAFREQVASLIETLFDISGATVLVIGLLGVPLSRALVFLAALALLVGSMSVAEKARPGFGFVGSVASAVLGLAVLLLLGFADKRSALFVAVLAATNSLPWAARGSGPLGRSWNPFALLAVGVAEVFFLGRYVSWIAGRAAPARSSWFDSPWVRRVLAACVPAAAVAALLFQQGSLVPLEQAFRLDSRVQKLASGDFNWIELDATQRYLFVTGHGLDRLRRYDTHRLTEAPLEAAEPTGNVQGFAYDPLSRELYVANQREHVVQILDSDTLRTKRVFALKDLSPGDPWIRFDPKTETLSAISEADEEIGVPFQVLERASGKVLDGRNEDPGNVLLDESESMLYLGYFRRNNGVRSYDLATRQFVGRHPTRGRPDRLAHWTKAREVLAAIPMESRILRLGKRTLDLKGELKTIFGVRSMVIDEQRQLLFCVSLATGALAVIDLATGREVTRAYVSPWLRTVQVDPSRARAYLTSNGGLYQFDYQNLDAH